MLVNYFRTGGLFLVVDTPVLLYCPRVIYRARIDAWFEQILDHRKCPGLSRQEELAHKLAFNDDNVPSYP